MSVSKEASGDLRQRACTSMKWLSFQHRFLSTTQDYNAGTFTLAACPRIFVGSSWRLMDRRRTPATHSQVSFARRMDHRHTPAIHYRVSFVRPMAGVHRVRRQVTSLHESRVALIKGEAHANFTEAKLTRNYQSSAQRHEWLVKVGARCDLLSGGGDLLRHGRECDLLRHR